MPPTIEAPAYIERMTEAQFQAWVIDVALTFGWLPVHFRNMIGNPDGYPDLTLFKDERVILAELKSARGEVSRKQRQWHERLAGVGARVYVWRPSDRDEIERVLREGTEL